MNNKENIYPQIDPETLSFLQYYYILKEEYVSIVSIEQELLILQNIINSLKNIKKDKEILINIGNNVFMNIKELDKNYDDIDVIYPIGFNIFVTKKIKDIETDLSKRLEEIQKYKEELKAQIEEIKNILGTKNGNTLVKE